MKCAKCNKEISLSRVQVTEDGQFICADCAIKYYRRCGNCSRYIPRDGDRYRCEVCEGVFYERDLNGYSTKPRPIFKNKNKTKGNLNNRYYGLEIEFSNVSSSGIYEMMKDLYQERYIYNKSDSSLNNGVEVVTNPCDKSSLKELIKRMEPTLDEVSKQRRYTTNAGIHIHVNRKSISPIDIYKLSYLLNFNKCIDNEEKKRLYFLCGRSRRYNDTCDDHYFQINGVGSLEYLKNGNGNRYLALNLTNTHTVEFRLFKSTAKVNVLLSYIELVDKMIEFAHSHGIKDMSVNNFLNYLYTHTDNKLLLGKLRTIKTKHSLPEYKELSFMMEENLLDGITEDKYYEWLTVVTNCSFKDLRRKVNDYKLYGSSYNFIGQRNKDIKIVKNITNKLREMYVEKIKEGIDLLCA